MRRRSRRSPIAVFALLFSTACFLPNLARADDKADLDANFAEGKALEQKGEFAAAAKAYQRALDMARRVFGPASLNTARIMSNLAMTYAHPYYWAAFTLTGE